MVDVGDVLHGSYRIIRQIGSGGMGVVFTAEHVRLPKEVAIKVLRSDRGADEQAINRFRREAELCTRLGHENIVEVLDFNVLDDGSPYLVMELLAGESLRERLTRVGKLPLDEVLRIAREVADGLTAVHALGIVHRDLKPENLFLCRRGDREVVKILDFGISKILGSLSMHTRSDGVVGTPGYMSPEQARGELAQIDERTDQFALAAILYEALAGRKAFVAEGDTPFSVLFKVVNSQPLPLFDVPAPVAAAIFRGLAKERDQRFPDVAGFAAALGGPVATNATNAQAPQRKRGWARVAAVVIGLTALGGGAMAWVARTRTQPPAESPEVTAPPPVPVAPPDLAPPTTVDLAAPAPVPTTTEPAASPPRAPKPVRPAHVKHAPPRPPENPPAQDDLVNPYEGAGKRP